MMLDAWHAGDMLHFLNGDLFYLMRQASLNDTHSTLVGDLEIGYSCWIFVCLPQFSTYYTKYNNWKMTKLRIKFDPGYYTMV